MMYKRGVEDCLGIEALVRRLKVYRGTKQYIDEGSILILLLSSAVMFSVLTCFLRRIQITE